MAQPDRPFPPDVPVPENYQQALARMRDAPYCKSQNWQAQQMRAVRRGAHPDMLEFERIFIKRLSKLGLPFYAHNMVRTAEDQDKLFADGVSKARGGKSAHNFGMAVDIVHSVKQWGLQKREWGLIGHLGKEVAKSKGIGVSWGGDWPDFYDPAHWEVTGWKPMAVDFPEWKALALQREEAAELRRRKRTPLVEG